MNITMEQEGNYMSLFDFLGKPAGMELGREVSNEAIRRKINIGKREISNKAYTGNVHLYPEEFLKEYFGTKIPESTKYPKGSLLNELPPSDYQMGS